MNVPMLETSRLFLRPFLLSDASDVQRLAGNKSIADTTLNIPHPYEDGMAEAWIAAQETNIDAGEEAVFAITEKVSGDLLGAIGLTIEQQFARAELGYWMAESHWGAGYCTEAARRVLAYGFDERQLNRIHASHMARNPASGRVLQKIGMSREGTARQHIQKWGRFEDLVLYGLLRAEWSGDRFREPSG